MDLRYLTLLDSNPRSLTPIFDFFNIVSPIIVAREAIDGAIEPLTPKARSD
ncbi:hypothetical protein QUA97_04975 [Microcoleus sp. CZ3-B2]|uniref:hypothetical protein n=1 Tax=Microcoleus sp. CZ3-B2 TaxID=2818731 RepID=UPI002FCFB484